MAAGPAVPYAARAFPNGENMPVSRFRRVVAAVSVALCGTLALVAPASEATPVTARYAGAGVGVVRVGDTTAVDNGVVYCDAGDGVGSGGVCLPFAGDAVRVVDDLQQEEIAFQVCVDNDGDGLCFPNGIGACADDIAFSHDDAGNFFNPVGPLVPGFRAGCPGGPWRGYVVFLCEGVHSPPGDAHVHPTTTGTATVAGGGEGLGTFCGLGEPALPPYKAYFAALDDNLTCGLDAASDPLLTGGQDTYTGTLRGGPWHVANASQVTIGCRLTVNGTEVSATPNAAGLGAAFAVSQASFTAGPSDEVSVCTVVTWQDAAGGGTYGYDIDPATPGEQCPTATVTGQTLTVPQTRA